jgi:hypothetical protein
MLMQVVHFIRHGEGFHNIGYEGNLDAHLTPFGWHQAEALKQHIKALQPPLDIQVPVKGLCQFPCLIRSTPAAVIMP